MDRFESYLLEHEFNKDDIQNMYKQIKDICFYSVKSGLSKLKRKVGYYELLGFDILIDDKLKPYLLEINTNPALFTSTQV